jgi:hypothetical protein
MILFAKNSLLSSLYIDTIKASLCYSVAGEKPMPRGRSKEDQAMLEMALIGYQHERERIEAKIQQLQAQLKGKPAASVGAAAPAAKSAGKRVLSPAARKRIALAQKKRWAEHRKKLTAAQG